MVRSVRDVRRRTAPDPSAGEVVVIRSTPASGRRFKLVVRAEDQRFVITLADQGEEDQ